MKDFRGKVAVITGAGAGIGRAVALELARNGAELALSGRSLANVEETVELCRAHGGIARAYQLDVADRTAVLQHADDVIADFGRVNLVVNNAGVSMTANVEEVSWEDFDWIVNTNFWGTVHGTKAFLPHLIASGDGYVANVSSMFGLVACPTQSGYNSTKFALRAFTDALRQEMKLAGHPVGVSSIHPGMILTGIARKARVADGRDLGRLASNFERMAKTSPESAAKVIVAGIRKEKAMVLIGNDARLMNLLPRVLGSGYQRVITAMFRNDVA